jgi:hypothetical protein
VSSDAWNDALAGIEADLAAIEGVLRNGVTPPERYAPVTEARPLPTEPMPPECGARAEALLRRTRELEARAGADLDGIRDALRALGGRRPPAPALTGRIVDVGA